MTFVHDQLVHLGQRLTEGRTNVTICDCGHEPSPVSGFGYGRDAEGRTSCYDCCADQDRETLRNAKPGDRAVVGLYLSSDGAYVTNWPGHVLMRNVRSGKRHNWARDRYYVSATDELGRTWHGIGGKGEYAVLRLAKR